MTTCDYCGSVIIFGGVKDNGLRFCNEKCHQKGYVLVLANEIPNDIADQETNEIHKGNCPKCQGMGPVDVHTSYRIYSLIFITSWNSVQNVCCRSCGIKSQVGDAMSSILFGWWGIPCGLIVTPIQVIRNIIGIFKPPDKTQPSKKLKNIVKIGIATRFIEEQNSL